MCFVLCSTYFKDNIAFNKTLPLPPPFSKLYQTQNGIQTNSYQPLEGGRGVGVGGGG